MPIFAQAAPAGGGMSGMLLTFGLMFAVMYFLIIRPQQKRQKEHQKMLEAVKKGDRIITNGGLHGLVKDLREDTLLVKIAENTVVEVSRGAVASRKGGESE
ncbi:MAG: preprotein translocase subunit YajC [bacterium]|jgi:preprotein translocase subunit YajC|nr:preprotein translocase subunit YajC [bacterium]